MHPRKLTSEAETDICRLYSTTRTQVLARKHGVTTSTIRNILIRHKVKLKPKHVGNKYDFNIHFFDTINTEAKAYFLGLLYADGSVYLKTRQVTIELNARDVDILEKMKVAFSANHPLSEWYRTTKVTGIRNRYLTLRMSNAHFIKRCEELGLVERKSLILTPPPNGEIPDHLIHHFIRGYFDGDGSITLLLDQSPRKVMTSLVGTTTFCEWCRDRVGEYWKQKTGCLVENKEVPGLSYYRTSAVPQVSRFLDYIYQDATIYLERKWEKYQQFLLRKKDLQRNLSASSRYFGVGKSNGRFTANVYLKGKDKRLGSFDTETEAARTYDKWCIEHSHNLHRLNEV